MQSDEQSDRTFADEACARLDPVEPSAALLRRIAAIPIVQPIAQPGVPSGSLWQLWQQWSTRYLILGSLALGASLGAIPLERSETSTESAGAEQQDAEPLIDEDAEVEDALALALGTSWNRTDILPEESR